MTGLECLKEEMLKRGCSKALTESKAVGVVLEIVADGGTVYTDTREAEEKLNALRREIERYEIKTERVREQYKEICEEKETQIKKVAVKFAKIDESLKALEKRLMECETQEARDAIRTAQFFVNNIKIDSPQNNTAFIYGLAMIIAGHNIPVEPFVMNPIKLEDIPENVLNDWRKGLLTPSFVR